MAYAKNRLLVGDYLKRSRKACGYSQRDVGLRLNYTGAQFISNWERGVAPVPVPILRKLIKLYNLDAETLIEVLLAEERFYLRRKLSPRRPRA